MRVVVADGWIVRAQFADELTFDVKYFRVRRALGLPEGLLTDREVPQFFPGEVLTDQFVAGTSEVVGIVCQVAANVDFPAIVTQLVTRLQAPRDHSSALDVTLSAKGIASAHSSIISRRISSNFLNGSLSW